MLDGRFDGQILCRHVNRTTRTSTLLCFQVQRPVRVLTVMTWIDQTVYKRIGMQPDLVLEDVLTSFDIASDDDVKIFMLILRDVDDKNGHNHYMLVATLEDSFKQ